jgi:hypothetical protein
MLRRIAFAAILVVSLIGFAQQQGRPPYDEQPPVQTPPTFPQDQDPGARPVPPDMPPDVNAPPRELSDSEVREQIQSKLNSEPALKNNELKVDVTDDRVIVSGETDNQREHELALRVAESYAGERPIVDKIVVKAKT